MPSVPPNIHNRSSGPDNPSAHAMPLLAGLKGLAPSDSFDSTRLLSMLMALAGEVFVLKGEVQRLKVALAEFGPVGPSELDTAAHSAEMNSWLAKEEREFGESLLRAFNSPDEAPDVSAAMAAR